MKNLAHNSNQIHILTPCSSCGSKKALTVAAPAPHHAALRCADCNKFFHWAPKPKSQDLQQETAQTIAQLLSSEKISSWENFFLRSISHQKKLSPKQREILNKIEAKVGGAQ